MIYIYIYNRKQTNHSNLGSIKEQTAPSPSIHPSCHHLTMASPLVFDTKKLLKFSAGRSNPNARDAATVSTISGETDPDSITAIQGTVGGNGNRSRSRSPRRAGSSVFVGLSNYGDSLLSLLFKPEPELDARRRSRSRSRSPRRAGSRVIAGPSKHGDALLNLLEPEPELDARHAAIKRCCEGLRSGSMQAPHRSPSRSCSRSPRRAGISVIGGGLRENLMKQVTDGAIKQLEILRNGCVHEIVLQMETDPSTAPSRNLVDPIEVEEFCAGTYQHCVHIIASVTWGKFYIGICCSPLQRWLNREHGHVNNWCRMILLVVTTGGAAAKLEKALIHEFRRYPTCTNIGV